MFVVVGAFDKHIHSDRNVELMIPDFIGAGFIALQPLQNSVMDIQHLKQKYGNNLTLMDEIDTRVLSTGDFEVLEKEVLTKIRMAGGYIVTCDGPVPPAISLSAYQYFVETVRKYGTYPLRS